jgi:hypothetical protein
MPAWDNKSEFARFRVELIRKMHSAQKAYSIILGVSFGFIKNPEDYVCLFFLK